MEEVLRTLVTCPGKGSANWLKDAINCNIVTIIPTATIIVSLLEESCFKPLLLKLEAVINTAETPIRNNTASNVKIG
jgi:hypothetical protein